MKKFFALAAAAMMALAVNAQVYVGVGAGFDYTKVEDAKTTKFAVIPEVGYNINDKLAVGADFAYNSTKVGDADAVNTWNLDVYGRYYIAEAGPAKFFGELAVGYENYGKDAGAGITVKVRPGVSVALSEGVNLVGRFNLFKYAKGNEDAGKIKTTQFGVLNGNSSLEIGLAFNI